MRFLIVLFTTLLFSISTSAQTADAFHLDVIISIENGQLQSGTCVDGGGGLACSSLAIFDILGQPPYVDFETGYNVFVSNFNDAAGGANSVDDPGYFSVPGTLPPGLRISYEALGSLQYWDPATNEWSNNVPGNTQIVLFGKLTNQISADPVVCGGIQNIPCVIIEPETITTFTESGVTGDTSFVIGDVAANGEIHEHLDWFVVNGTNGNEGGPAGAYMADMKLTAPGYQDSEPFSIVFAKDISNEQFRQALEARTIDPNATAVPVPAFAVLILLGIISLLGVRKTT